MVSVFLIITSLVMSVIILICVAMLVIKFGHPDDKNAAKFPTAVVIFGLFLAFASVLIMPYDIANTRGAGGGIRVDILWQIVHVLLALMLFFVIPFAYFYYENDLAPDQGKGCCASQGQQALMYTFGFSIVFILLLVIMYAVINEAHIPVTTVYLTASNVLHHNTPLNLVGCQLPDCSTKENFWIISVTFPIYLVAFISFIGWFFFTMFVGVGMIALPMDLINEFRTRPKPLKREEYEAKKQEIGSWAAEIISQGQALKEILDEEGQSRSQKRRNRKKFQEFEVQYNIVKVEWKKLEVTQEIKGENGGTYILWGYAKLVTGIVSMILSLTWIIHICVFIVPSSPVTPFLNTFFITLEDAFGGGFPLFGVLAFAIWSYYLLWCCIKGSFKLGLRFFIWKLYPMELGGTLMNSFLVNTWLLLLCSVPIVQFCSQSFPVYARLTDVDMLFGTQIKYLKFFSYFWAYNIFIYVILGLSFISLIFLLVRPDDSAKNISRKIDARAGVGRK